MTVCRFRPASPVASTPVAALFGRGLLAAMLLVLIGPGTAQAGRKPDRPPRPVTGRVAPVKARSPTRATMPAAVSPLVVVDAGHGGHDPGAVGPAGTLEKTVALATAQDLARQLRATGRYRVRMTRGDDRFVPLERRVALASASGAALLISVHADASTDPRARGASVYVWPAAPSGPAVRLPAERGSSRAIARALSEPASPRADAARLQLALVDSLGDDLPLLPDPARQARLHVLGTLGIPSVLVEVGFLSNPREEALLRQPRYRARVARAIRGAVDDYFAASGRNAGPGGRRGPRT